MAKGVNYLEPPPSELVRSSNLPKAMTVVAAGAIPENPIPS